jgi:hypothetical protein
MGRKILNRKEMRADFDAAERRKKDDVEAEETEEEEEDEDEDEGEEGDEEEPDVEEPAADEGEAEEDEEAPKKKKAKAVKPPKAVKKTRTRTPKITRMKVIWGVFNNSNQRVATFDYPRRKDADDLAAKLSNDKKSTHFVQPVKEPMEEKEKEKEKDKKGAKDTNPDKK